MTSTETTEVDASLRAAFWGVGIAGLLLTVVGALSYGASTGAAVLVGALVAYANLWAITGLVRVYLYSDKPTWALVGALKTVALFGLVYWLVTSGKADVLPLVVGFGALPVGIAAARLKPAPRPQVH